MRCELVGLKNALHRSQADAGRLRQHSAGPVRHFCRWGSERKINNAPHRCGWQWLLAGLAGFVAQKAIDALAHEALLPAPYHRLAELRATHDLVGAAALGRRQDHLGALHVLLFSVAIPDDSLQPKTILGRDRKADPCSHAFSMNCFVPQGNPLKGVTPLVCPMRGEATNPIVLLK